MAQDIRELFEKGKVDNGVKMSSGHEKRFLDKLSKELPKDRPSPSSFNFLSIAASIIVLLGLSYGAFQIFNPNQQVPAHTNTVVSTNTKTMGDYSPDLKKVEDYYLASINLELSKLELTPENKDLVDGYMERLKELNDEYDNLTKELNTNGPNESTLNALIDNLKFRLNLVTRLKDKIKEFNDSSFTVETI